MKRDPWRRRLILGTVACAVLLAIFGPPHVVPRRTPPVSYLVEVDPGPAPAPDDNAAIPLLRALGTGVLLGDRHEVLALLGAPAGLPAESRVLPEPDELHLPRWGEHELGDEQRDIWRAWIADGEPVLDAVVEASKRPRLWLPVVRDEERGLVTAIPPEMLSIVIEVLDGRAELAVLEGRHEAAWDDIQALLRLHALGDQLEGLLARIVASGMAQRALERLGALLEQDGLGEPLLRSIRDTLATPPRPRTLTKDLRFDRFYVLDRFTEEAERVASGQQPDIVSARASFVAAVRAIEVLLADGAPAARAQIAQLIDARTRRVKAMTVSRLRLVYGLDRRPETVGRLVGEVLATMVLVLVPNTLDQLDRVERERDVALLGAALRLHKLRHGAFPETLDPLIPAGVDADGVGYEKTEEGCSVWDAVAAEDEALVIELSR